MRLWQRVVGWPWNRLLWPLRHFNLTSLEWIDRNVSGSQRITRRADARLSRGRAGDTIPSRLLSDQWNGNCLLCKADVACFIMCIEPDQHHAFGCDRKEASLTGDDPVGLVGVRGIDLHRLERGLPRRLIAKLDLLRIDRRILDRPACDHFATFECLHL